MKAYTVFVVIPIVIVLLSACGTLSPENVPNYDQVIVQNLGENVNSKDNDFGAATLGERLYFTSDRPTTEGYIQGEDFWFADREGSTWTHALNLGGSINTDNHEGSPYITPDGKEIFYTVRDAEAGLGKEDIYSATMEPMGRWQGVNNLGDGVNTKYWDSQPFLTPDAEEMYFVSDRPGGLGGTDIWVSKKLRSGKWGPPKNLGAPVNTSDDEKGPMISPDGEKLYFSSDGHPSLGGHDIFVSTMQKRKWGPPKNLGRPFNSPEDDMFFRFTEQEDSIFLASSRSGGLGGLDLYVMAPNPFKDTARYQFYVSGMVFDSVTFQPIQSAKVEMRDASGMTSPLTLQRNARFRFRTEPGAVYTFVASAEEYIPLTVRVEVPRVMQSTEHRVLIGLMPVKKTATDTSVAARPTTAKYVLYFDFDKAVIRPDGQVVVDQFFMAEIQPLILSTKNFEITVDGHACDVGTEDYNFNLSRRRGNAVVRALRAKGVPVGTMMVNAYGETRPAVANTSEEMRQLNRRVELFFKTTP